MEVRKGYKQTEVGIIPEDWDVISLGEIFEFKNGLNKSKEYFGQGTPIVNYMDVYKNRGLFAKDLKGMVALSRQEIKNYEVEKGDVFFTRTSETVEEVGTSSIILDDVVDTVFSGFVLRARHKTDRLDNEFEKYCYSTYQVRKEITSKSSYTTRALTNGSHLSKVKIAVPATKIEQHSIAVAIGDVDYLLNSLVALIAKKRLIKQGAMQELLTGRKRLPGFSGEWEVKKLSELARFINGRAYKLTEWEASGTPVIRLQNLTGGEEFYYSNLKLPDDQYCDFGDLLYMWSATFGPRLWAGEKAIYHYHIWKVEDFKGVANKKFLFYKLDELTQELKRSSTNGGTMLHVTKAIMENTSINIPSFPEQTAIAEILSDMDVEISALEQKREKTRLLKQGMMQELLTGRIRLV